MNSPALEAEYAYDERTALNLYDCLIPRLREHRRLRIQPEFQRIDLLKDLRMTEHIRKMELELALVSQPKVLAERRSL